ncbi:MAG: hypothetical protein J3Q66DRAFT_330412 [Benniella sp.]|nr:MAG: hypothetical protein J3Q66DRAFT_330412 [Benniella sp.]
MAHSSALTTSSTNNIMSNPPPSGTLLTTIPELPGDEYECESAVDLADDILITETAIVNAAAAAATSAPFSSRILNIPSACTFTASAYARSKRLSINMTLLSPSLHTSTTVMPTPPSGSFSPSLSASSSSTSSTVSSPGSNLSPSFSNDTWASDLRQYIMTDIGPQPSNTQVPGLRSHPRGPVRRKSYSKLGGLGFATPAPSPSDGSFRGLGLGLSFPNSPSLPCLVE